MRGCAGGPAPHGLVPASTVRTFDDVSSWNLLLAAYLRRDQISNAFRVFAYIFERGIDYDKVTLTHLASVCGRKGDLACGRWVHDCAISCGMDIDVFLAASLICMYTKCGSKHDAHGLFDRVMDRNVVCWNTILGAFEINNLHDDVFSYLRRMQVEAVAPDRVTLVTILSACSKYARRASDTRASVLVEGEKIHSCVMRIDYQMDVKVINALITLYGSCGALKKTQRLFLCTSKGNIFTWNAMISVIAEFGYEKDAIQLLEQMKCEGFLPDKFTFLHLLNSYVQPSISKEGRRVHVHLKNAGFLMDVIVATALVSMYGRCGDVCGAKYIFDQMAYYNNVSWNAMINAYSQNGFGNKALRIFTEMLNMGELPNESTFISVLSACTTTAALTLGRHIHHWVTSSGFEVHAAIGSALTHMYAKCGSIVDACMPSHEADLRDLVSWNTVISSYAQHGCGKEALQLYKHMQCRGAVPNEITLVNALYACSHSGLVDEAQQQFISSCFSHHHLGPTLEHFHCMIDLFGRVGLLDHAEGLLYSMPFQPSPLSFMILLGACRLQHDIVRGEPIASHIFELDLDMPPACVMLSNIYYAAGMGVEGNELRARVFHADFYVSIYKDVTDNTQCLYTHLKECNCMVESWKILK